jgi:hypothetical protein
MYFLENYINLIFKEFFMIDLTSILVILVPVAMVAVSAVNLLKHGATLLLTPKENTARIQVSWMLYLLLTHITFFWGILTVFQETEWTFMKFTFIIIGPSLLILSSALIGRTGGEEETAQERYMKLSNYFLPVYALLRVWQLLAQAIFDSYETSIISVILTLIVVTIVRFSSSYKWHISGSVAVWLILIYTIIKKSLLVEG